MSAALLPDAMGYFLTYFLLRAYAAAGMAAAGERLDDLPLDERVLDDVVHHGQRPTFGRELVEALSVTTVELPIGEEDVCDFVVHEAGHGADEVGGRVVRDRRDIDDLGLIGPGIRLDVSLSAALRHLEALASQQRDQLGDDLTEFLDFAVHFPTSSLVMRLIT